VTLADGTELELSDEPAAERFVARIDGAVVGAAYYTRRADSIVFTHTEVADAYEGHGVGSALARYALDAARSEAKRVVPLCPFIAGYLRRHDEYADLVDRGRHG
jgi:predicted GNAT family acetyltransferase